ncbi:MAG: hypothetical protein GY801_10520 [bacterium]|nr:hypothetical protein [bacterium]
MAKSQSPWQHWPCWDWPEAHAIGIATTEPGQDALEAFTEHLIHAVETFPENAANVYGQVKDFLLPPRGMESAEEMRALHEHFRQAAAMAKADGEDASSVTPTDDDKICEDPGKKPPIGLPPYLPWTEEMEDMSPKLPDAPKDAERRFKGQYGEADDCVKCANLGQEMWGGDVVNVIQSERKPGHYALQLPDGRYYDPSYLGNFRGYNQESVPQEILDMVGENDTFSPELYDTLRKALEDVLTEW